MLAYEKQGLTLTNIYQNMKILPNGNVTVVLQQKLFIKPEKN